MDLREIKERNELTVSNRHPWEQARLAIVQDILTPRKEELKGKVILDIGCGDIFVVEALSDFLPKSTFYAVDIAFTDETIAYYSDKLKGKPIKLYRSMEDAAKDMGDKKVSLVTLLDVIEHIEEDVKFMKELHANPLITKETEVLITVPAYQNLFCSHDTFLGHYRRYTNQMLREHLSKAGFSDVKIGYFFFSLILPRYLQVQKEKKGNTQERSTDLVDWDGSAFKTWAIKTILLSDYYAGKICRAIGINLAGLSNFVICKKSA